MNFYDRAMVMQMANELARKGEVICTLCQKPLMIHGCYQRQIKDEEGNCQYGWVAQGHCSACHKYPSLIPNFIMPYKHYEAAVIESVIMESEAGRNVEMLSDCAADASTMRRWIRQFKERGALAVGWLISLLFTVYEWHISILELQNKELLKQLAQLLQAYSVPASGTIIGKVNIILTRYNCGFL